MQRDRAGLDDHLDARGVDGYLLDASSKNADQFYLSGFDAPDPFVTLYNGEVHLLFARGLEYGRATREADAATVSRGSDFEYGSKRAEADHTTAWHQVLAEFLAAHDVGAVATPPRFPLLTADGLREEGISVVADDSSAVEEIRARKTDDEVAKIRSVQRANEAAMASAESLLASATVSEQGTLELDGEVLTSERVKREIEFTLLEAECALDDTIVACAREAADPHDRGSGPLQANEPIIVDIFPQHKMTRYCADLTRTFCRGEPHETLKEWYELTERALSAALDAVAPGVTGEAVHDAAASVYEDAGLPTLRTDETTQTGFIHSTGHGVGLEVHEQPRVGSGGGELEPGNVVTIEPGLYDPDVGGVRLEDLVVVTDDGCENLTEYELVLQPRDRDA